MTSDMLPGDAATRSVRFNAFVNIMDGAFFGSALGFASFITVIPLFVSQLTDSPILIGLIPAIHTVGWQLPQLFTAGRVQRLSRYKPMVLATTIHERLPFLGLALLAWFLPGLRGSTALILVFALLVWQGLGGGYTAAVWQSMIGKIIPASWRGGFFGLQSSAGSLLATGTAVAAGWILERFASPLNFTLCFLLAAVGLAVSFGFLAATREEEHTPEQPLETQEKVWHAARRILSADPLFRRFLAIRFISHLGMVAFSYYAVYCVEALGAGPSLVGLLTGVLIFTEMIANPLLGLLGDRRNHWLVLFLGALAGLASCALAGWSPALPVWFAIFALAGVAYVTGWITPIVLSLEFGSPADRPTYIGLSNTLIAPAAFAAPFLAGWCIEAFGHRAMFLAAALVYLAAAALGLRLLRSPRPDRSESTTSR